MSRKDNNYCEPPPSPAPPPPPTIEEREELWNQYLNIIGETRGRGSAGYAMELTDAQKALIAETRNE